MGLGGVGGGGGVGEGGGAGSNPSSTPPETLDPKPRALGDQDDAMPEEPSKDKEAVLFFRLGQGLGFWN